MYVKSTERLTMSDFESRELQCSDCGKTFEFSVEDQEFYAQRGYAEPKRCPECRKTRRTNKRKGHKQMFKTVCAECGCETTVPFQPTGEKPVYCKNCFKNHQQQ